jgi:hypothetical protein
MAKAGYTVTTNGAVALTGGAAKTVLAVLAPAQFGVDLKKFRVGFDGVTASAVPVLYDFPLGDTPDSAVSQGFAIRVNAPAAVNVRAAMWFERC